MMSTKEISKRNDLLIAFIRSLGLNIQVLEKKDRPKLVRSDYKVWFNAYVKNFNLILMSSQTEVYQDIKLKPVSEMDIDGLRAKILLWIKSNVHKEVYTLHLRETKLLLVGFNYHDELERKHAIPVFGFYYPVIYKTLQEAEKAKRVFSNYDLIVV